MPTLHIEPGITDFDTWTAAFGRFAGARRGAGVHDERFHRPVDDHNDVVIDLDFETADEAAALLRFLETVVWSDPVSSPALAGAPRALILERSMLSPTAAS